MQNPPQPAPIIAVYQTRRLQFHHFWGLILCGVCFIFLPAAYGLLSLYSGYTQYGPSVGYARGLPWLAFAAVAAVFWLIGLIARLRTPQYKIALYRHGLQFEGSKKVKMVLGPDNCLEWEALTGIAVESFAGKVDNGFTPERITSQNVKLFLSNGEKITISETAGQPGGLINLPELVSRIKAILYPRLNPKFQAAFATGQSLSFGALQVQKEGIQFQSVPRTMNGAPVPWDQIGHITIKSGYLVVELNKSSTHAARKKRVPIFHIPNLELLLQIIKENVEG